MGGSFLHDPAAKYLILVQKSLIHITDDVQKWVPHTQQGAFKACHTD